MKTTMIKQIGISLLCSLMLAGLLYVGFRIKLNLELNLQTVFVASHDIMPRQRIGESDLIEMKLPEAYLDDYVYRDKEEILGRYTDIQGKIPAGSCFYHGMLWDEAQLPDYPTLQLRAGQAAYSMPVDLARSGGQVIAGQRVDIYVSVERNEDIPVSDCLIRNARVLTVKDHNGLELTDEESSKIPYFAVIAIHQKDVGLLATAEKIGEIRLISTDRSHETDKEAQLEENSEIIHRITGCGTAPLQPSSVPDSKQ